MTNSGDVRDTASQARTSPALPPLIVIAEDHLALRLLLANALERTAYRVVQAETGQHLIRAVDELVAAGDPPRLIISDVKMPVTGGLDAADVLRRSGHATPLIFMTAYGDAWTRRRAAELGALLLDKPLALDALRRAVRHVLVA